MKKYLLLLLGIIIISSMMSGYATTIETQATINAPREDVWQTLTAFKCHTDWNPFMSDISGDLEEGTKLVITMRKEDDSAGIKFNPVVLRAAKVQELRWRGRFLIPGLFTGEHYFLLEGTSNGGTLLTHGEHFSGALLIFAKPEQYRDDFTAINAALKKRVESGVQCDT